MLKNVSYLEDLNVLLSRNNTYKETSATPEWSGILLIQPYGKKTTSFAGVTINIEGTKYEGGEITQDWYLYCGDGDTQITEELAPTLYENGVKQTVVKSTEN